MQDLINHNSNIPMYTQVKNIIFKDIQDGKLNPEDKLPSEAELINTFNVSRITIRAAIAELVDEGILTKVQGKGTFVASQKSLYQADDSYGFSYSCLHAGKTPTTKLISKDLIYPNSHDIKFLGIQETEKIVCIKRLRYVDNVPTMIEVNHYPISFSFLLSEDLDGSLLALLSEKYNIQVKKSIRTLEICKPTKEEASLLGIKLNTPLLLFRDNQQDSNNKPLFTSKQVYYTERLKFYL